MNDTFEKKVRAAAVALWWVVLIALGFIVLQWLVYLTVIHIHGRHGSCPCGGLTSTWVFVQTVWFWAIAVLKFIMWLMVLVALWLTLWARQLRKACGESVNRDGLPDELAHRIQPR